MEGLQFGMEIEVLVKPRDSFLGWMERVKDDPQSHGFNHWNSHLGADLAAIDKHFEDTAAKQIPVAIKGLNHDKAEAKKKEIKRGAHGEAAAQKGALIQAQRVRLHNAIDAQMAAWGVNKGGQNLAVYENWKTMAEPALDDNPGQGLYAIEIVSRVLKTSEDWILDVETLFQMLNEFFELRVTTGCSLHVHTTPLRSGGTSSASAEYNDLELRHVALGTMYFEAAFARILPPERKQNPWARPNNEVLPWAREIYRAINGTTGSRTWRDMNAGFQGLNARRIVRMMGGLDHFQANEQTERHPAGMTWPDFHRYQSTNFNNVLKACKTIETRRFPGVKDPEEVRKWVQFALGMQMAMIRTFNWTEAEKGNRHVGVTGLREALASGMARLENTPSSRHFEADDYQEDNRAATTWDPASMAKIEKTQAILTVKAYHADKDVSGFIRSTTPTGSPTTGSNRSGTAATTTTSTQQPLPPALQHLDAAISSMGSLNLDDNPWADPWADPWRR